MLLTVTAVPTEPPDVDGSAMSPAMWVAVAVFAALVVLTVAYFVRDRRKARASGDRWAGWTSRVKAEPVRLADDDTREIRVPSGPRHRARNERPVAARMSNAAGRFAATVAQARGRR